LDTYKAFIRDLYIVYHIEIVHIHFEIIKIGAF
jgi:hypothetical protein